MNKFAYIFDFDGVLVNTMHAHFLCYQRALSEVRIPIDKKQFYRQAGMTGIEQIQYFASKAGIAADVAKIYARKRALWNDEMPEVNPIECNIQLLKTLRAMGHPVAVASGSTPDSILPFMKQFDIEVDILVTALEVKRGKPHPDLFLTAADELGMTPDQCVVIEDSDVGIEAAQAAGMMVMRFFELKKIKDGSN